jgi:hypothetical protein
MSTTTIAADFHQTFDVQGFLTTEVTFHFIFMIQDFTQLGDFSFRQILDTSIRVDPGFAQDFPDRVRPIP